MQLNLPIFALIALVLLTNAYAQEYNVQQLSTPSGATIKNYEAKGNLDVTHELDCIPLASVKSEYTPPDLYNAFAKCVRENSYENATGLFLLAGGYLRFDVKRVADKTAHQARTVLIMQYSSSLSLQQKNKWNAYADKFTPGSKELDGVCEAVKKIGIPTYYPTYMIKHGITAFSKDKLEPLVKDFDQNKSWETILKEGLHCTI